MSVGSIERPRVLVVTSTGLSEAWVDEIRAMAPTADMQTCTDQADAIMAALPGAHALLGCPRNIWSDELLRHAGPTLRWVHASGAGCEEFITPELVASDVVLTNGRIIQGPEVADHALALLLALARNLHLMLRGRLRGRPNAQQPRPIELRAKTVVVIGVGGIGLLIAERASAFGMRVIGVDPEMKPMVSFIDAVYPPDRLTEVLPQAAAVIVAAPHTFATERWIGTEAFSHMTPESVFINVSRGRIVDTDALVDALRSGRPRAAGLDVTEPEPLPADHPLMMMDNVIVTHHTAGLSDHNRRRSQQLMATNVARFVGGMRLLNIVDKKIGF